MLRLLQNTTDVVRCDIGPSANDLRWTLLPALTSILVVIASAGALLTVFDQELVRGYALVHGHDEDYARVFLDSKYKRAVAGVGALCVCFVLNRYYFLVLLGLILLVTISVGSDYASTIAVQYSDSRFERYLQEYGVELFGVSVLYRLAFLGLLLWAAKDVWTYHMARPK